MIVIAHSITTIGITTSACATATLIIIIIIIIIINIIITIIIIITSSIIVRPAVQRADRVHGVEGEEVLIRQTIRYYTIRSYTTTH